MTGASVRITGNEAEEIGKFGVGSKGVFYPDSDRGMCRWQRWNLGRGAIGLNL